MKVYEPKIEKEEISKLPACSLNGKIIVVDEPSKVEFAVNTLREAVLVGFDTETRPCFVKGHRYKVALLQLSTPDVCFLFRLQLIGKNQLLKEFLEDQNVIKVGLSTRDDTRSLQSWMSCRPSGFVDIQQLVSHFGIQELSLQKVYAIVFGERISKSQQLSNWEANPLSPAQQLYAATDAWSCVRLFRQFQADDPSFVEESAREMIALRLSGSLPKPSAAVAKNPAAQSAKRVPRRKNYHKPKKKTNDNNNSQDA